MTKFLICAPFALLSAFGPVSAGEKFPLRRDGPLSANEIGACLLTRPQHFQNSTFYFGQQGLGPGQHYWPGYNYRMEGPEGSNKYGHFTIVNGGIVFDNPKTHFHGQDRITRRNGSVYVGDEVIDCT
jgi:hypothetical protein